MHMDHASLNRFNVTSIPSWLADHLLASPPATLPSCPQVDDSGKVQRLRKQCPNCGPGTFMATHFDRVYCGKCSNTFVYEGGAPTGAPKKAAAAPAAAAAAPEAPAKGKKGKK